MARHFEIKIRVAYDEAHGNLDEIKRELKDNVGRCVEGAELLNDMDMESVIEEWSCEVKEVTVS